MTTDAADELGRRARLIPLGRLADDPQSVLAGSRRDRIYELLQGFDESHARRLAWAEGLADVPIERMVSVHDVLPHEATTALQSGRVDAIFTNDPAVTDAVRSGVAEIFGDRPILPSLLGSPFLSYLNGTLILIIVFSRALIPRIIVDRFPSLISNFKMATSRLMEESRVFTAET